MNWKNRNLRILNVTSYSMNGAVASIILKKYYNRCDVLFASYRKQDELLKRFMENKDRYDAIIFTNFAPTQYREGFLSSGLPIAIFDHHENAMWWKNRGSPDFHVNKDYSGAMMVYMYFKRWAADLERYEDLANLADDFERWVLKDARSFHLNTLFWKSESVYKFIDRWSCGGRLALTEDEKAILTEHVKGWKKYYEELDQLELPWNGRFITSCDYLSEISKQMDNEGVNYFMVYHPKSNYITLRSCNALLNCEEVLRDIQVYSASSKVGVVSCRGSDEAKRVCDTVTKSILSHIPG